jgi:hypothetical protein
MAQFKLEYLQILPEEFTGQRALLPECIKISVTLITNFYNASNLSDFTNILLVKAIKNRNKQTRSQKIRLNHTNREERTRLIKLLESYTDIFHSETDNLSVYEM